MKTDQTGSVEGVCKRKKMFNELEPLPTLACNDCLKFKLKANGQSLYAYKEYGRLQNLIKKERPLVKFICNMQFAEKVRF